MVLTREIIRAEMEKGNIVLTPFDGKIGPASLDISLGNDFRRFKHLNEIYSVTEETDSETITEPASVKDDEEFLLKPGETVLGITKERLKLNHSLCAWIEGRSRFARIGLGVHITSGFVQPGVDNFQVLEITNLGPSPLGLKPGVKICQLVFQRCEGAAEYTGKYKRQTKP